MQMATQAIGDLCVHMAANTISVVTLPRSYASPKEWRLLLSKRGRAQHEASLGDCEVDAQP